MEEDGWEAKDVSLGASVLVPPVWKSFKLHGWPSVVLCYSSGDQLLCTVYVHTSNMHVVSACFRNPLNYDIYYRIFKLPSFSNACVYTCFLSQRLTLFILPSFLGGLEALWPPFISCGGRGGPLASVYEILQVTLCCALSVVSNPFWHSELSLTLQPWCNPLWLTRLKAPTN